jgi:toxin FitB
MIILDTNVISETQRLTPDAKVLAWLDAQSPSNLYLTSITVGELMFGVHCLPIGTRFTRLLETITAIIEEDFHGRVLPYDDTAARIYGQQLGKARRSGMTIGQADGQIAAIALAHEGALLATPDYAPFEALGVGVVRPWG